MNNKYAKYAKEQRVKQNMQQPYFTHKGLCQGDGQIISKAKRIIDKNERKGQNSLQKFFGTTQLQGVKSNKAAFEHYVTTTSAYSAKMISENPERPRDLKASEKEQLK
jgi:hypothetical protein